MVRFRFVLVGASELKYFTLYLALFDVMVGAQQINGSRPLVAAPSHLFVDFVANVTRWCSNLLSYAPMQQKNTVIKTVLW